MVRIIDGCMLENIPIICKELAASNKMIGPVLNALKGKTVSDRTPEVQVEINSVPVAIMSLYQQVTVVSDILFVNRIPCLISISLHLKFCTVERLENCCIPILVKAVHTINKTYVMQGFNPSTINMDPEFEPLCDYIDDYNIILNICTDNEHVP